MIRRILCLALAATLVSCGKPPGPEDPSGLGEGPKTSADAASAMKHDDGLRPLDAPLEITHEEGVEPRAVEALGPDGPTLLVTAAIKGYVEPCTCTLDTLLGGIDRISGYMRSFSGLAEHAAVIDAGDLLFEDFEVAERDAPQSLLKARLVLQAHAAMGTLSTTPGPYDLALGVDTYRDLLRETELPVTVANLTTADGASLGEPHRVLTLGDTRVGLVGVVDPALFSGRTDVTTSDPAAALEASMEALEAEGVDLRVAVAQGELRFARDLAQAAPSLDFVIIGHEPRETDEVTLEGTTAIVESYSQGRYAGVLRLYPEGDLSQPLVNARQGSAAELEKIDRRIKHINDFLDKAPPALPGQEPPLVKKKRDELEALTVKRLEMSSLGVERPEDAPSFAWFAVSLEPGYPLDVAIHQRKKAYDADLESLYTELQLAVAPAPEGTPSYVGDAACVDCHQEAYDFWKTTPHSHAFATLEHKGKTFDPDCISCHVTGYGEPGGSIVGSVEGLQDVQCESCHGPGSIHAEMPVAGEPGQVKLEVPAELCVTCHDPLNSPRFSYDRYLPLILGPGHGG